MEPPPKRKARRLHRGTGDRAFASFRERLAQVNAADAPYAYRVKTVVLFGSYATDTPRVGDVDVAVELEPKFPPHSPEQKALEAARRDTEHYRPRNMVEGSAGGWSKSTACCRGGRRH
jgi:predicted nucleotidyltransferase